MEGECMHAPLRMSAIIHFEVFNRMKYQAVKDRKIQQRLVCVELAEGDLGGTDVLTTTGAALWYEQGEQSSLVICINDGFGCQTPRLQEIQAITNSFPKQRVECRGQQHMDKL